MKKLILTLIMIIGISSIASARDKYSHDINTLPTAAQTTLKKEFKAGVSLIKTDKEFGRISEYEVILTDGTEVTFDRDGNWKNVETAKNKSVPKTFVMNAIHKYVAANQPNTHITGIEKERNGYEVELSNGIDMKFDRQGTFIRYDH